MKDSNYIFTFCKTLEETWSCIPALTGDWDTVSCSVLERLAKFLRENDVSLKSIACINVIENNVYSSSITEIYRILLNYSRWFCACESQYIRCKESTNVEEQRKALLAYDVYILVVLQWMDSLVEYYPQLLLGDDEGDRFRSLLICSNPQKSQDKVCGEIRDIVRNFTGDVDDKISHISILLSLIENRGGKEVALWIKGALDLKWIIKPLRMSWIKEYFHISGNYTSVANFFNSNKCDESLDDELPCIKSELLRLEKKYHSHN